MLGQVQDKSPCFVFARYIPTAFGTQNEAFPRGMWAKFHARGLRRVSFRRDRDTTIYAWQKSSNRDDTS